MKKILIIITVLVFIILYKFVYTSKYLPSGAVDVKEYYFGEVDYVRAIKAKVPYESFLKYVNSHGKLKKFRHGIDSTRFNEYGIYLSPEWWDEPKSLENCYFYHEPEIHYLIRVKWREGIYYYAEINN